MLNRILDIIIPDYCLNCQKKGTILCDSCKNYISNDHKKTKKANFKLFGVDKIYYFTNEHSLLKKLVYRYKLASVRSLADVFADFYLEMLPKNTKFILIPLPTAKKHIRQRGFDHVGLIADKISAKTGWQVVQNIDNFTKKSQKDLSARDRVKNVANAFVIKQKLDPTARYLIIDDFVTTGASVESFTNTLKKAGAQKVELAILIKN